MNDGRPNFLAIARRLAAFAFDGTDLAGTRGAAFVDMLTHELGSIWNAGRDAAVPVDIGTRQPRYRP